MEDFYAINKLTLWKNILTVLLVFVSSLLLVLIQSRAGQIGALVAAFLLCASALKTQPKRVAAMIALMLFGLAIGVFDAVVVGASLPHLIELKHLLLALTLACKPIANVHSAIWAERLKTSFAHADGA